MTTPTIITSLSRAARAARRERIRAAVDAMMARGATDLRSVARRFSHRWGGRTVCISERAVRMAMSEEQRDRLQTVRFIKRMEPVAKRIKEQLTKARSKA